MKDMESVIRAKLAARFAPTHLEVINESDRHRGHAGIADRENGATHFRVTIVSAQFAGVSRIARQRAIMETLKAEMDGQIHALALRAYTPEEMQ